MNAARGKHHQHIHYALIILVIAVLGLGLPGCQIQSPTKENSTQTTTAVPQTFLTPLAAESDIPPAMTITTSSGGAENEYAPIWEDFSPPSLDPATPIPPPMKDLDLPDEVLVWVLLGTDKEPPFIGRTKAIHLLFIHPRFSKASLVSIPGDLYVYIPGYTMQRLNIAYALGGIETLRNTLAYNFGVTPSRFVLAHPGDFQWLVDDINNIEVTVFFPIPQACGGIRGGVIEMDGALALCYASYRDGMDEIDRMRRQQQLLQIIFRKFTRDGNLVRLPLLYASYEGWIITDLSLSELTGYIPLALRLGDQDRIGYYIIGWDQIQIWDLPGYSQAQVFLPNYTGMKEVIQQAINDIITPEPLTNQVQTLEAQLTEAYHMTASSIIEISSTPTMTLTPDGTTTLTTLSPSSTPTPPGYP